MAKYGIACDRTAAPGYRYGAEAAYRCIGKSTDMGWRKLYSGRLRREGRKWHENEA